MSSISQRLYYNIEIFVISEILLFSFIQFLTEISYWVFFLVQNSTYTPDASHATSKTLVKSGRHMTRAKVILDLISIKVFAVVLVQENSAFLIQSIIGAITVLKL